MTCPSTSTSATSTRPASSPFDRSTGDLILQSSDGVEFHCFSQILVAASPVFEGMVAVGNPTSGPSNTANDRPIVPLTEDSKTLDFLLRLLYPIPKASLPRSLEDIEPLLEASMKYIMEFPKAILTQELLAFAQSRAMRVWAIGCRLMLEEVARAGAERMLQYKTLGSYTHVQQFVPIEEFIRTADARGVTAADYSRLWTYYRHRGKVEDGFSFTRPLPREAQDQPAALDRNIPWAFFLSEVTLPDATCFSQDGMPFSVHAGLLCMSSPVLKKKVLEVRRSSVALGGDTAHCCIHLMDESPVLAHLLRLCYPGDTLLPTDHRLFLTVLKAAKSYDMTRVVDLLSAKWDAVAGARPTSAYFAALEHGFPELARVAALKISPESSAVYIPEMENAPAMAWQRLKDYWAAAEAAIDSVQKTLLSFMSNPGESKCRVWGQIWIQECRNEVLADVRQRLVGQEMPTVEDLVRRSVAPTLVERPWCVVCCDSARDILRLGRMIRDRVISELDKVPLIV